MSDYRPAPNLHLICPPVTGEHTCIIREDGHRQEWKRIILAEHELDYFDLADLWPGSEVWEHEGRFLGGSVMRYLTLRMANPFGHPGYSEEYLEKLIYEAAQEEKSPPYFTTWD